MKTRDLTLIAMYSALTAVGAFIKIPIPYVPFTLQIMFTYLSGLMLGAKKGALAQLVYVITGLIGIPVFSAGGGLTYIFQPTFGYLIGFILGAFIIGILTENKESMSLVTLFFIFLAGLAIDYLFGVVYLYLISSVYLHNGMSLAIAIKFGFLLPIGGDLILCLITAMVGVKLQQFRGIAC